MTYLLDANVCIELMNKRDSSVAKKLASVSPRDIRLCSVVKAELYHGAYKSGRVNNLNLVKTFSNSFESLAFDDPAAETYGRLRTHLEKQGKLIGPNDLLIASIALTQGVTLITHNTEEFGRVPGLALEDWQEE
jgi:tRNA(fMet)-specific endonuclease VapC